MTRGTDFEELLASEGREESTPDTAGRSWTWIPLACIAVGALICAGVAVGMMTSAADTLVAAESPAPVSSFSPRTTPTPVAVPSAEREAISDRLDADWVATTSDLTGIPERPLRAYAGAALVAGEEFPACGLGWNTLAGIGFVESEHGTIHGSRIGEDGVARPGIIGIPLTGESSLAILDSDGGALDGDTEWDRAVGPMQFIPETWSEWGADGDGDGMRDPQNIDDSALSAARYLCFAGGDLTQSDNWITAIHAYNPSVEYNNRVADAAQYYADVSASL